MSILLNALLISLVASLGTGLGGLIAMIREPGKRSYGFLMGMTAGVMISLSFLGLVNHAWVQRGFWMTTIGFSGGAIFMLLLDFIIPHIRFEEMETRRVDLSLDGKADIPSNHQHRYSQDRLHGRNHIVDYQLLKTGILLAIGITLHNLPEGIAVGASYMFAPQFGLFIGMAILLHNIPEGIATALPLFKSGVYKWTAFRVALLSGLAEPVGALVAVLFLRAFQSLVPGALAFAGGVMMFITLDELIPTAREHGHQHFTAIGIICGSIFVFLLSGIFNV